MIGRSAAKPSSCHKAAAASCEAALPAPAHRQAANNIWWGDGGTAAIA